MTRLITAAFCAAVFFAAQPVLAEESAGQRAVLITGASTGIGRLTAEHLAANGYFVYAGARKANDIEALNAIENVKAVRLDVTSQEEIDAAVELVRSEGRGLWGVVNNAGVGGGAPLIEVSEEELKFLFDVNVYGVFRVTKSFAPLIIESKGRIVNISSISGFLSGYGYGPYSMTKHAVEAFNDSLRREMRQFEVEVVAIEPGNYNSAIGNNFCSRLLADAESKGQDTGVIQNYLNSETGRVYLMLAHASGRLQPAPESRNRDRHSLLPGPRRRPQGHPP